MSEYIENDTGCKVTRSHITGDIVCQEPGPDCDCLIVARRDEPAQDEAAERREMFRGFGWSVTDPKH